MNFVLNRLHDFQLECLNPGNLYLLMSNFLVYGLHLKGIDVLEFGGHKHTSHTCDMEITDFLGRDCVLEESVLQVDCQEERLVVTLEIREHFNHPVDHSCPQNSCDFMVNKAVTCVVLLLQVAEVVINVIFQLVADVDVLTVKICGVSS